MTENPSWLQTESDKEQYLRRKVVIDIREVAEFDGAGVIGERWLLKETGDQA